MSCKRKRLFQYTGEDSVIGKRVLDLNAGLGGRVYALETAGFDIAGAIDQDPENCEIMASWLGTSKVIQANLLELESESVPDADLIMGKYIQRTFLRDGKEPDIRNVNISIFQIISKKNPFAFLLEVPVSSIVKQRHELDKYMQMYVELGYHVSYTVYEETEFSGFPMVGKQAYIIGEKNMGERRFHMHSSSGARKASIIPPEREAFSP